MVIDITKEFSLDIDKMHNLLVAGKTGSGKSYFLHKLITSISKTNKEQMQLVLIDVKNYEFDRYKSNENLYLPIANDEDSALNSLNSVFAEIDRRLSLFEESNVFKFEDYNKISENKLPRIIVIIDEAVDLLGYETKGGKLLQRIAALSGNTGVDLVLSTQMLCYEMLFPSLKANLRSKICFSVFEKISSLLAIGEEGAEKLKKGEFLYYNPSKGYTIKHKID